MNDQLKLLWFAYLTVKNAAMVIRDPIEKHRMNGRAARRLDAFFLELERHPKVRQPWGVQDTTGEWADW